MQALNEQWRKSTKSGAAGQCVEVRRVGNGVEVRDSKNPQGQVLAFTSEEWTAFLGGVEDGEFGL